MSGARAVDAQDITALARREFMITITFKTLMDSYPNLKKVSELNYLVETRYRMAKALMHVEHERAHYEKQQKAILRKHGEPIDPSHYSVKRENVEAFNDELDQLNAIVVSIPMDKLQHTNVQEQITSPADIVALAWLIDWPELGECADKPFESSTATESAPAVN
jgi:hypothetical protein